VQEHSTLARPVVVQTLPEQDAPITGAAPDRFERPFPALTSAQRLYLEINGYVVVPGVLSGDECGQLNEALQKL